jgi:hypothetical protein
VTDLPPDLSVLASLVGAQPAPVRAAFRYSLALAMAEAGKARLVETVPVGNHNGEGAGKFPAPFPMGSVTRLRCSGDEGGNCFARRVVIYWA